MMKLTDYVANFLADLGITQVFGVTGGAVVHLFDSLAKHPRIQPIFTHHEQAAALAAEGYARARNDIGVAIVTTGPGGTNAITGVCAAWLDSVPCIYISGQTRKEHTSQGKAIRQLGVQEYDILSLVTPITKYAAMIEEPQTIKYHLQKAVHIARSGRPGPVWIDIPLNFQWSSVDPEQLKSYNPELEVVRMREPLADRISECQYLLSKAKRPVVLAGYGIRLAQAEKEFARFIEKFRIPFLSTWNASDLNLNDGSLYMGRPGIFGQRGANLAIQNCDFLLCIGSHLSIPLTGTRFDAFARDAKIVMVDIDHHELEHETVHVDLPIHCDAKLFLERLYEQCRRHDIDWWRSKCSKYKAYNGVPTAWKKQREYVNPHVFIDQLSSELDHNDNIVVDGGGTVNQITFQAFKGKEGQRLMISAGLCAMGTGLPESVGAYFGSGGRRTICLIGDGSLQFNIQELQTIMHHNLPVKIFVFNNDGYIAIRHTQNGFLDSHYVGSSASGGLSLPNYQKVAKAYGIQTIRINNHRNLRQKIRKVLMPDAPVLCEIMIDNRQEALPRMGFDKNPDGTATPRPLEDMYPYLDRKEFFDNMVIKPHPSSLND